MGNPILYIVIPCYNEEAVLPLTSGMFLKKIKDLAAAGKISDKSRILFVNDGSKDKTWDIIRSLAEADEHYRGVCLSRNRGHQNALLAGLMTAKDLADVTISIDCDGQDDINAMDAMIDEYLAGMDVVYGVRSKRETDTWFKRTTAEGFYKVMKALGADVVFNHADYRLLSKRALEGLAEFREVNLFLRGLVPLVGYRCSSVYYERAERIAGESHYPLKKMLAFAFDGITSLSVKPLRLITLAGMLQSQPPKTYISVRPERYSHGLITESREFVINLPTAALVRAIDYCGVRSGRDESKFEAMHLTALAASQVSCPLVGESPVNLECRVTDIVKLGGSHDMFIADIVAVNVDEELLDEKGRLRLAKAGLCTYAHGEYFALGKKIGDFGFSVKKKKKKPQYDRRK